MIYIKSFESLSSDFSLVTLDEWNTKFMLGLTFSTIERDYLTKVAIENRFKIEMKYWIGRPNREEVFIIERQNIKFIFTKSYDDWYYVKGYNIGTDHLIKYYKCDQLHGAKIFIESI